MKNRVALYLLMAVYCTTLPAQIPDDVFAENLESSDLVILNEDTKLLMAGKKGAHIKFTVQKDITYKILNENGFQAINPVIIPETFDEVYQSHNSTVLNDRRLFDMVLINHFEAWRIYPDSTSKKLDITATMEENSVVTEKEQFGTIYNYSYTIPPLSAGDVVRLKYSYSFPFIANWQKLLSTRIFLEAKTPRQNFSFTISHHSNLFVEIENFNGAKPKSDIVDNMKTYTWTFANQPGGIDEPGARPFTEIPYITITPKPYDFLYQHFDSFIEEFIPTWYLLVKDRESKIRKAYVDDQIGVKTRDNYCFERLAKRFNGMAPEDTTGIGRLRYFQRYIADSVRYDNAASLYDWLELNRKRSPGCDLASSFIREPNKEFIYANMIPKFNCQYFTAYLDDNRSGQISENYLAPLYDNELLFAAITSDNKIAFIIPKSDSRNMYCEELPFYYENTPVMLLFTYDYAGYKRNFNEIFRIILTPGSSEKDNYRKVNSMVNYDAEKSNFVFITRISLSGQYSTLTYPVYLDQPTDQSINPKYHDEIWNISNNVEVLNRTVQGKQIYFPFKSSVETEYALKTDSNTTNVINLDIGKWIKHVYYENFDTTMRFTDYYADFTGSDAFNYMIKFNNAIEIKHIPERVKISNNFGIYQFEIKQTDVDKILISSYFLVKSQKIDKSEISQVGEIFNALEEVNALDIVINLKQ